MTKTKTKMMDTKTVTDDNGKTLSIPPTPFFFSALVYPTRA